MVDPATLEEPHTTWKARFHLREERRADDGSCVRLLQDGNDGSWLIGRAGDPRLDPIPLGAFQSAEAARHWADAEFPGGSWVKAAARR
jgi:hypothetical protein